MSNSQAFQSEFLSYFEIEWKKVMHELKCNQKQLLIGSRLRPQIVMWGYMSTVDWNTEIQLTDIAYIAVSIELIHKASLLLDDWIDDDNTRHGENSFHIDYGVHSTVMIALLMVTESLDRLLKLKNINNKNLECVNLIVETAKSMTSGVIKELSLNTDSIFNYIQIKEISLLETSEIISNSLLLGYHLSKYQNRDLSILLKKIGELSGYLFQTFNDLEAFSDSHMNKIHKGKENYDFNRIRKNLVISKLYGLLNAKEKLKLENNNDVDLLKSLYSKYKMDKLILREMELVFNEIINLISVSVKYGASSEWSVEFKKFMFMLKNVASKRLGNKSFT